jgi:AmiR/NasT family two-component response regulator
MTKILVVSRHTILLASALNHLYENGFDAIGALRDAEAVAFLKSSQPDLVVLSGHFEETEQKDLRAQLIDCQEDVRIISFSGGVKNLLPMVNSALEIL